MIDHDPVIWEHLLEVYIELFRKLTIVHPDFLSTKSRRQLVQFLKGYLYEISEETTRVFSLGAINPAIVENQRLLKLHVFLFLKEWQLSSLDLEGAALWDFCKVYVKLAAQNLATNQSLISMAVVRRLVDDKALIQQIQDHLVGLVAEKKFKTFDLEVLYMLLGGGSNSSGNGSNSGSRRPRNKKGSGRASAGTTSNAAAYASHYVNTYWLNELERLYNNGESIHSKECFQVMLISVTSLTSDQVIACLRVLHVRTMKQFAHSHPLLAKIVLSKKYQDVNHDILSKLQFLKKKKTKTKKSSEKADDDLFSADKMKEITELFPQLTPGQVKTVLLESGGDVKTAVERLLEHPEQIQKVQEYKEKPSNEVHYKREDGTITTVQIGKKNNTFDIDSTASNEELKKKSLERALKMMYESDEDEPDDTYLENERTDGRSDSSRSAVNREAAAQNARDMKLFEIYKSNPELFATRSRHTNYRRDLCKELGCADEQLEGWARMLERNPHKFRMLEQQRLENGGSLNAPIRRTHWHGGEESDDDDDNDNDDESETKSSPTPEHATRPRAGNSSSKGHSNVSKARSQQIKAKNKAKRGNHSRKSGHDRKVTTL